MRQLVVELRLLVLLAPSVLLLWPTMLVRTSVVMRRSTLVVVVDCRLIHDVAVRAWLVGKQRTVWLRVAQTLVREQRGQVEVLTLAAQQHVVDIICGIVVDLCTNGAPRLGAVGRRRHERPPAPLLRKAHVGDVVAGAGDGTPHGPHSAFRQHGQGSQNQAAPTAAAQQRHQPHGAKDGVARPGRRASGEQQERKH